VAEQDHRSARGTPVPDAALPALGTRSGRSLNREATSADADCDVPEFRSIAPAPGNPMRTAVTMACLRGLLAALLALVVLPVATADARGRGPVVGIGEQKAQMFKSGAWKRLGLRDARYTMPWDVLRDPRQLALLDDWMAAARRARVRVLLGFAHSLRSQKLAQTLPSVRRFAREFRRLRRRYPRVRDWLVWNEANHPGALTERRPGRAAGYFNVVARNCRGCRIVAADLLDTTNMAWWVNRFKRRAKHRPRIWGLHNYGDTNGLDSRNTQKLLGMTRGKVWFTETGGLVLRRLYRGRKVLRTYRYTLRHAARATRHALSLACTSRRIQRVYLYHWQAPPVVTSWDSGLLNGRGRRRPAYFTLRRSLKPAATSNAATRRHVRCQSGRR
jgi:hypothetical protein